MITFLLFFRTKETIMNVIHCQRPYWKCFQAYDTYEPTECLNASDNFFPNLKYEYEEITVHKYPTRDVCPVNDDEKVAHYDSLLDKLIESKEGKKIFRIEECLKRVIECIYEENKNHKTRFSRKKMITLLCANKYLIVDLKKIFLTGII